jgi:hypothetical protein
MKEYMLLIRNETDAKKSLGTEEHLSFIRECETYIGNIGDKLIAAQPLIREGVVISKINGEWKESELEPDKKVQVGYYHILANDIKEAVNVAKNNPEFDYVASATIEVREIKTKEEKTAFVYPK